MVERGTNNMRFDDVPEQLCGHHAAARHDADRGIPQPARQRRRPRHPACAHGAVLVAQHRAAADAIPFPGVGLRGRTANRAAARRASVRPFLGSGQPASGAALPRNGAGPARSWRQRVGARCDVFQPRDVAGCRGVHRRHGTGAADPDGSFDGWAQCDAADPARSIAAARAGDRRCRPGSVGPRTCGDRRFRARQRGVRRSRPFRTERAAGTIRTARASTSNAR